MITLQHYKGDDTEIKYIDAAQPTLDIIASSLNELYAGANSTDAFLLMLYDEMRVPYTQRIKREAFVAFIKGAFDNFPFIGTFDSYIFVLRSVFGPDSDIIFTVPAPGKLEIAVNAAGDLLYELIGREIVDGAYDFFNIGTSDGDDLMLKGFSGIETEAELALLFSEIMPAGIFPTVSLDFFLKSTFYASDSGGQSDMITSFDDNIIFIEVSGG